MAIPQSMGYSGHMSMIEGWKTLILYQFKETKCLYNKRSIYSSQDT